MATQAEKIMTEFKHVYEVRPRKYKRGFDLLSDRLPFGPQSRVRHLVSPQDLSKLSRGE